MIQTQKIYCRDCYDHFRIHVRLERNLSYEQVLAAGWLIFPFALLCAAIYGVYYLDRILKSQSYVDQYNERFNNTAPVEQE